GARGGSGNRDTPGDRAAGAAVGGGHAGGRRAPLPPGGQPDGARARRAARLVRDRARDGAEDELAGRAVVDPEAPERVLAAEDDAPRPGQVRGLVLEGVAAVDRKRCLEAPREAADADLAGLGRVRRGVRG